MKKVTNLNSYNAVPRKGISWRAIFAGVVTVISVMLVLNLIGLSIGLGSIEPTEESNPLSGLGTGSLIWWIVSSLMALFAGGYVASRVGVSFSNKSGIVQGIMTWALYTLISAWLLTSAVGSIISGVGNVVGSVLSTTGQVVGNQLGPVIQNQTQQLDISLKDAKQEFYSLLEDTQKEELDPQTLEQKADEVASEAQQQGQAAARQPGSADAEIEEIFNEAGNVFEGSYEAVDKQALANILVERTDMSESEAERTVENYLSQYENLRQQANEFLKNTKEEANQQAGNLAKAVSDAALYLSLAMILGIIAAAAGGFVGVKSLRDDYHDSDYIAGTAHYVQDRDYIEDRRRADDARRTERRHSDDFDDYPDDRRDQGSSRGTKDNLR